ncbi:MAG: ribonuclease D, partial [Gemmatimonadota bacterium]
MTVSFIQDESASAEVAEALAAADQFALDLEAAGFHRYSDRLCLVQVSTRDRTWVLDPLALDARKVLQEPVEDPKTLTVMHGADFDLRLLDRDLDLRLQGLFDTQVAASLIGEPAIGLSSLLD